MASITLMFQWCVCVCGSILSWDRFTAKKNVTGKPWKTSFIVDKSKLPSNISRKKITSPSAPTGSRNHRSSRRLRRRSSWAKSRRNDRTVMTSRPALVGKNQVCRIEIQACRKRLIKWDTLQFSNSTMNTTSWISWLSVCRGVCVNTSSFGKS